MKTRINICTINLNEGEGRQTISYDTDDRKLYSSACDEPVYGYAHGSLEEAVEACNCMWGSSRAWGLEWV